MENNINTRTEIKKLITRLSEKKLRSSLSSRRRSKDASRLLSTSKLLTLEEKLEYSYAQTAFCCLSKKNKFRLFFIAMVEQKWFMVISYTTIILSIILMLVYTYSSRLCSKNINECMEKYQDDINRDNIMDYLFIAINVIFLTEMLCKMLAQGIIMQKGSYLRSGWNILDCAITVYSFIETVFPYFTKLYSLRLICLLRVIKSMDKFTGIKRLIASIILSLPTLGNVLLFLGFVLLVFGTIGTQLFSGLLYNRCRLQPELKERTTNGTLVYYSQILLDSLCSKENDSFVTCPIGSQCVNFYNIPQQFHIIEQENFTITVLDDMLADNPKLKYGIPNFDTIFNSIITAFSLMTIQSWTDTVNILLDGASFYPVTLYFNAVVIIGGFFIIKLILAAQNEAMIKVRKEEIHQKTKLIKERMSKQLSTKEATPEQKIITGQENENANEVAKLAVKERSIANFTLTNESGLQFNKGDLSRDLFTSSDVLFKKKGRREIEKSYQNNSILIIEQQMFVHLSCDLQSKISKLLLQDPQNVDLYLTNLIKAPHRDKNILKTLTEIAAAKIKFLILEEHSNSYQYLIFNGSVYVMTILNLIFLCHVAYPMTEETLSNINAVNIACTSIFALEIAFKVLVLGLKRFLQDALNIVDGVIVLLGLFEIIFVRTNSNPEDDSNCSFSSIRAIRFIRVLKLFKTGSFLQEFVTFFMISLQDLLSYCLLLVFFSFLFSTTGRELFTNSIRLIVKEDEYHFKYAVPQSPRENFDTIINSFVTVFILFIGDNWPNIMYEYCKTNATISKIYFCTIIMVGNLMLFNLFLSILLSNYDEENRHDLVIDFKGKDITKLDKIRDMYVKVKEFLHEEVIEKCLNCCEKENVIKNYPIRKRNAKIIGSRNNISTSVLGNFNDSTVCNLSEMIPLEKTSLYLFSKTNRFRKWCHLFITKSKIFKYSLFINIILSLLILAFDCRTLSNTTTKKILMSFDIITTIFFFCEAALKSIACGFLFNGENSYLRYEYNFIDFGSLVLSASYIISTSFIITDISDPEVKSLGVIKVLRIIRVMKIVAIFPPLQSALSAFYESLKQMSKIILIGMLFILVFGLFGVTYFRGRFHRCDFAKVPVHLMRNVETKWDCLDYGGSWVNPYPNFDNIKSSVSIFFEMMTTEGWASYMFKAMDASSVNMQPVRDIGYPWSLFFILYMIIAYFFLFNMSIVILCENYQKEKQKIENYKFPYPIQNEFFNALKNLYKHVALPITKKRTDKFTKFLVNIIDSIYFDVVITACIISNLLVLMLDWPGIDARTVEFIEEMSMLLNCVFIGEAILKIIVYRLSYFTNPWNILDFVIAFETMISLLLNQIFDKDFEQSLNISILRALRVGRIIRLLKKAHSLNKVFNLFINSIPGVINVLILYFLVIYMYSIIGMNIFSSVKYQTVISKKWNFQNFSSSFLMLIRVTTGEGWNVIMHEYSRTRTGEYFCKYMDELTEDEFMNNNIACGTLLAYPYFLSFVILANMMFLEFFSVIIASAMGDTYVISLEELKNGHIKKFQRKWALYDKDCTGFMPIDVFQRFLYDIGYPFGISTLKVTDYIRICSLMNICTYHKMKYIFFYDVLTELAKYYLIHKNVEDQCEGQGGMFTNPKEMMKEKIECFIDNILLVSQVQENRVYQMLNPYGKNKKFKRFEKDEFITGVSFTTSKSLLLHHSWALRKISSLIRCYKSMKIKCLVLMKSRDKNKYASKYLMWVNSELNPNNGKAKNNNNNNQSNTEAIPELLSSSSGCKEEGTDNNNNNNKIESSADMTINQILKNRINIYNLDFSHLIERHSLNTKRPILSTLKKL